MLKVSIVTVSQFSRIPFLNVLAECIKCQDYKNIIEWIIVDASKTENNLEETIKKFMVGPELPYIMYVKSNCKFIGGHRNKYNEIVNGDIVVCMDDDDYYPPQRVSHCVETLKDKKYLIAGCETIILHDIYFNETYQYKKLTGRHTTNNCMAYWHEYLKDHKYDENVRNAEEDSFTNLFTVPMAQMDPYKTIFHFSHDENTYNKRKIILDNKVLSEDKRYITVLPITPQIFINNNGNDKIYDMYQKIFDEKTKPKDSIYDIVYYCGTLSISWSPIEKSLGGSEQAVVHLSEEWAKMGKRVAVYGNVKIEGNVNGVDYFDSCKIRFWDNFKTLIFWRMFGIMPFITMQLKYDKLFIDLHDNDPYAYKFLAIPENSNKITNIMVKSEFHKNVIDAYTNKALNNIVVIPNGVRINNFSISNVQRQPFRFCYCSCYTRGLQRILKDIWPIIYEFEPTAELHIYYGMDLVQDQKFKDEMKLLLSQPGVMDHGRQSYEVINKEKHLSTFHFYYTDTPVEIDCISIRESLVAGCIPIISNVNVFAERDGVKVNWIPNLPGYNRSIACGITELMNNDRTINELREKFYKSPTITSWTNTANKWIEHM